MSTTGLAEFKQLCRMAARLQLITVMHKLGVTQADLCRKTGFPRSAVSKALSSNGDTSLEWYEFVLDCLGYSMLSVARPHPPDFHPEGF